MGPVLPGNPKSVTVTLRAKNITANVTGNCATSTACNSVTTDYDSKDVKYADTRISNDASANVPINMVAMGEIHGTVWIDSDDDWNVESGETRLPGVNVTLYGCRTSRVSHSTQNSTCSRLAARGTLWLLPPPMQMAPIRLLDWIQVITLWKSGIRTARPARQYKSL